MAESTAPTYLRKHGLNTVLLGVLLAAGVGVRLLLTTSGGPDRASGADPDPGNRIVYEFEIFSTYARLTFWAEESRADSAYRSITAYTRLLHDTINVYDDTSELSRLNQSACEAPFTCSDELWSILQAARYAYRETSGAFDISVGPLMSLWGFHRHRLTWPTEAELNEALEHVGLDKVIFDDAAHSVRFTVPGMHLDLGGIAKGYALDRVAEIAREHGIRSALIDLGGNIGCSPALPPGRDSFVIGIRDPVANDDLAGRVSVRGMAVATSGNYEKHVEIEGRKVAHIIDPRTGQPVTHFASVTVITPRGVDSDVFSTGVFVQGQELIDHLRQKSPETSVITATVDAEGQKHFSTFGPVEFHR